MNSRCLGYLFTLLMACSLSACDNYQLLLDRLRNNYNPLPERLTCDELLTLVNILQPYWEKELTEEQLKADVQSHYPTQQIEFLPKEFDGELWWVPWRLKDVGITVLSDTDNVLKRVRMGLVSAVDPVHTPLIHAQNLEQCMGTEPDWYFAYSYRHFECGTDYVYSMYYTSQGVITTGGVCGSDSPPSIAMGMPYHSIVIVSPGDIADMYCRAWNRDLTDTPADVQPQPWSSWETIEYFRHDPSYLRSIPKCQL